MLSSLTVTTAMSGHVAYRRSSLPIGKIVVGAEALPPLRMRRWRVAAPSPEFAGAGGSLGDSMGSPPVGSAVDLTTVIPGFWAIVVGAFPTLDLDGDLAQFFLDDDDDGGGLDDDVETGTGVFVSASNTGTSPVDFDTDGDGLSDGAEVLAGTDPNDASSPPPNVPFVGMTTRGLLVVLLILTAMIFGLNRRRAT